MANIQKQQMRISDVELEMLKSTFADQDELLKTIRNLFYGMTLTEDEKKQIKDMFSGEQLRKLMRKQFLPELQKDIPIGQCIDLWMTIDLKDKDPGQIDDIIKSRSVLIGMIEESLKLLENPDGKLVDTNYWIDLPAFERHFYLVARNQFLSHIDQQLVVIRTLAGLKTETIEETKKRLMQDSTR